MLARFPPWKKTYNICHSNDFTCISLKQFYKDEGGKKNCLIAVVKVENLSTDGEMTYVPTVATICYESGEEVEEKHQVYHEWSCLRKVHQSRNIDVYMSQYILKLINESGPHAFNVPANGTEKKILFRIEKVACELIHWFSNYCVHSPFSSLYFFRFSLLIVINRCRSVDDLIVANSS